MKKMFLVNLFLWSFLSYSATHNDDSKIHLQSFVKENIVIEISPISSDTDLAKESQYWWCHSNCLFFNAKLSFKWEFFDYVLNQSAYLLEPFADIPMPSNIKNYAENKKYAENPFKSFETRFSPTDLFCGENCEIFQLQHTYFLGSSTWWVHDPFELQVVLKSRDSLDLSKLCVPNGTTDIVQMQFRNPNINSNWIFLKNIFLKNRTVLKPVQCYDTH